MSLHVHEFGPAGGRPMLALHGLSAHGARFADLAHRLGRYRILAPDLRGHGLSPVLPPWDLARQVDDVLGVLDRYGLGRVPVLGHSLGGVVALRLAESAPDRVAELLLLDPGTGMSAEKGLRNADAMLAERAYPSRDAARADRLAYGWRDFPAEIVDAEIAAHTEQRPDGLFSWRYRRTAMIALIGELTRPVPLPPAGLRTLLVVAEDSDVVSERYVAGCRDRLGELLTLSELDCGHLVYYERPAETAAAVESFLAA